MTNHFELGAMIEGIKRWVETESPSQSKAAVNRMIDLVQSDVAGLPVKVERVPGKSGFADNLIVRNHAAGEGRGILILSHIDTVHPIGTLAGPLPFRRDGDKLYGPGLFDMKGGAYLALEGGKIVTSRKGVGRFEVKTIGVPAHSGARHQDGRSAIKEMARQVLAIEGLTDYARGVTTTVGMISGGTAPNVIPQHCRNSVDLRVCDVSAGEEFEAKILGLEPFDQGVKVEVTGGMNRPPFEMSTAIDVLFRHAQAVARDIGFDLQHTEMTGGGSDGNFTAALGVPTLDGLGIDGDGAHTEWEHGLISSIEPRTRLMRGLLESLQ